MTIRRRTKLSSRAARAKRPIPANNQAMAAAPPKRAQPPLIEPFHLAVDRQLKSGYGTYEAAEKAALAIKRWHPQLQVSVYDAKEQRHTIIERPKAVADPHRKPPHRLRSTTSERQAVAGAEH